MRQIRKIEEAGKRRLSISEMGILETYTKRQKRLAKAGTADVYQYDDFPVEFRRQVIHIWTQIIGPLQQPPAYGETPFPNIFWRVVHDTLAEELGVFSLGDMYCDHFQQCQQLLLNGGIDKCLDIIELSFRVLDNHFRKTGSPEVAAEAVATLNHRFREHCIGFEFVGGQLIRIDAQFVHAEAVKPAIILLSDAAFRGASEEFLKAHEHYLHKNYKEAINESLKAFESTMRVICDRRKWKYPERATAKGLIDTLFAEGLIPAEMASHFSGLRATLEGGLPTLRNRTSGHGQGSNLISVPDHLAAYAIHLAASNIVLCVRADNAMN